MWQTDITSWRLAGERHVEILNIIDDHSRLFLGSDAYPGVKAKDVVASFHAAAELHGLPASLLSDNGAVFTGSYRGGKVMLESELERLGVAFKNSRPYHPQTCGKVERSALPGTPAARPDTPTATRLARCLRPLLQRLRPHRALDRWTPFHAYNARVKARPAGAPQAPHFRVRQDKVDQHGKVNLRYQSKLYKIGLGRAHKGRQVKLLIADQNIRVITLDGETLRELTLDPSRKYHRSGVPSYLLCPATSVSDVPRHNRQSRGGIRCHHLDKQLRLGPVHISGQFSRFVLNQPPNGPGDDTIHLQRTALPAHCVPVPFRNFTFTIHVVDPCVT